MLPRLWDTKMHSLKLINVHFWLATIGTLMYITAMWISGIMQGLMWRAYDDFGNLQYSFAESVAAMHPYYAMRALGGAVFLVGMLLMLYNCFMTIRQAKSMPAGGLAASAA
jgi:cytochrome c oxidase cbb3-type subunit 1